MISEKLGLIVVVGLFLIMTATAVYIFQSQGGIEVFNPAQFKGILSLVSAFNSPGSFNSQNISQKDIDQQNPGVLTYYCDKDKDGYFSKFPTTCGPSCSVPSDCVEIATKWDCKDSDAKINPGAAEIAGNGKDENCDGKDAITDNSSETPATTKKYYCDTDGDSYFGSTVHTCNGETCMPSYCTTAIIGYQDCDDSNKNVYVGAVEYCDGIDNDCDKYVDEDESVGCTMYYYDGDQDGYGKLAISKCSCSKPSSYYVANSGDCEDTQSAIHPGVSETCNQKDDDCDGQIDEGACGTTYYYCDSDNDGYTSSTQNACTGSGCVPSYCTTNPTTIDCNDNDATVNPGKTETCNGKDDNCDGTLDTQDSAGCTVYYFDGDQDGYGTAASFCLCQPMGSYTATKTGDCNSNTAEANPGMTEKCDGIDNDCDGNTDEYPSLGCTIYYYDYDGDYWGLSTSKCLCTAGGNTKSDIYYRATQKVDCIDTDDRVYPGHDEICANHVDDDCDGRTDSADLQGCVPNE